MPCHLSPCALIATLAAVASPVGASAAPLIAPFDFSRATIELEVTVRGAPMRVLLDTGVNPSLIDLGRAETLGLKIDHADGGEATGFGDGKGAQVYPATIEGLAIGGAAFAPFETLASDMSGLSAGYGRPLSGVLGYSFLADKTVLIDYPARTVAFLDRSAQAKPMTAGCRRRWTAPLKTVDSFPIIPGFRFGVAHAPVSFDTGSNGSVGLFRSALDLPGVKKSLVETGAVKRTGARGDAKAKAFVFKAPVGFGPFSATDQPMTTYSEAGSRNSRVANIGNRLMAEMQLRVLLDYRGKRLTFYGECAPPAPKP